MTCQTLHDLLSGDALQIASVSDRDALEAHAAGCAPCARLLARHQALAADMRALASSVRVPETAFAQMEGRLQAVFEAQHAKSRRRPGLIPWQAWAAAAGIVLAVAVAWYSDRSRLEPTAATQVPRDRQARVQSPSRRAEPVAQLPAVDAPAPRARRTPSPGRARSHSFPAQPTLAGFVALPGASSLPDFESGQVVRLDVPLAELPSYGLEIIPHASAGAVSAELLIGQDGFPRAIRLASLESSYRSKP